MGAVTKWLAAGVLALAQRHRLWLRQREFDRSQSGALVRPVAERLGLRPPTGAPPVVAGGQLEHGGPSVGNHFFTHALTVCTPASLSMKKSTVDRECR